MKILSLSCVYPGPERPAFGTFVGCRLRALGALAQVKVISPVGLLDYSHPSGSWLGNRSLPARREDGPLEVLHPRWMYPPGGSAANPWLLAAQLIRPLVRLRAEYPFDAIDAHFAFPDGVAAALLARRFGVPFAITLRGNETMHAAGGAIRCAVAWALRRAARVIAVSDRLRDFAVSLGAEASRVAVIPNGVDARVFHPRDRSACRARFGIGSLPAVLSAGALIERKGHHRAVAAISALRARGVEAELLIAGGPGREGTYEDEIRRAIDAAGMADRVRLLGQVGQEEMAELMSAADALCLASAREGWPNVVHEAMACGTPVVATDVGGVPRMVEPGRSGWVVPAGDVATLADALGRTIATAWDRAAIAESAMRRNWEQVARETLHELELAVQEGRQTKRKIA